MPLSAHAGKLSAVGFFVQPKTLSRERQWGSTLFSRNGSAANQCILKADLEPRSRNAPIKTPDKAVCQSLQIHPSIDAVASILRDGPKPKVHLIVKAATIERT
jgi:hypothetical protein